MDIKSHILVDPKTFAGYGHAVWPRLAKFLELYEFIFEEKPCYTDLLIDIAAHLTNTRVFLGLENKTLSKSRVFSLKENFTSTLAKLGAVSPFFKSRLQATSVGVF